MIYKLYREQQLQCTLEKAWEFFSSPDNLPSIAPEEMDFTVLTKISDDIFDGMQIDYRLKPLFGIPILWKSEVRELKRRRCFVDFQLKGPYRMWHHHHEFIENGEGVLMIDRLKYEMPFGVLGRMVHKILVRQKLEFIFENRRKIIAQIFNGENLDRPESALGTKVYT